LIPSVLLQELREARDSPTPGPVDERALLVIIIKQITDEFLRILLSMRPGTIPAS
jgi:hypothetical protein